VKWTVILAAAFAFSAPAFASEPQFGRWAVDGQHCGYGGDTFQTSTLTVTETTLRWAAEYCTIGKMYKADQALYIEGRCSNGGMMTRHPITLAMKGGHLAVTWNGAHSDLQRCP
jgi:hypothetical protein